MRHFRGADCHFQTGWTQPSRLWKKSGLALISNSFFMKQLRTTKPRPLMADTETESPAELRSLLVTINKMAASHPCLATHRRGHGCTDNLAPPRARLANDHSWRLRPPVRQHRRPGGCRARA